MNFSQTGRTSNIGEANSKIDGALRHRESTFQRIQKQLALNPLSTPSGLWHPRQVLHCILQLVKCLEDELGVDPLIFRILPRDVNNVPVMAVGDGVVVVDLGEVVNQFGLLCHILILVFGLPIT